MSTITAILEADVDGSLHLPVPEELRHGKMKVTAKLEPVGKQEKPHREEVLAALERLRVRGTFREITDSVAWQREMRRDRPLPGREQ